MATPADRRRHHEAILRLVPPDPEAYAKARLGSLLERDPWVRAELDRRIQGGLAPLAAVDDVTNQLPRRVFELALQATGPSGRILDFGCGSGSFVNFGCGYDSVPNPIVAVDRSRPREAFPSNVRVVQSDLHAFRWEGEPFDMGLSMHVFEQVPDSPRLARRLRVLLRPGAVLLTAVPEARWVHSLLKLVWKGDDYDEVNAYTFESFVALMRDAGFEPEAWFCWPSFHSIHYGHVTCSDGRSLGELLDRLATSHDHANGTLGFSCYGYGFAWRAP